MHHFKIGSNWQYGLYAHFGYLLPSVILSKKKYSKILKYETLLMLEQVEAKTDMVINPQWQN